MNNKKTKKKEEIIKNFETCTNGMSHKINELYHQIPRQQQYFMF